MAETVILVDFGATRVKSVLWSFTTQKIVASVELPSPKLNHDIGEGTAEGIPEHYWEALETVITKLGDYDLSAKKVWICTEMHGFMLADIITKEPLTNYISWQDQRACVKNYDNTTTLAKCNEQNNFLLKEAGLKVRPGLPLVNLHHINNNKQMNTEAIFLTLSDWLLLRGGALPKSNLTLAASTGLCSIEEANWSINILSNFGLGEAKIYRPEIVRINLPLGKINVKNRAFDIYGGVGDMQAAAHGAGFPTNSNILINLGTGSQVMCLRQDRLGDVEIRPLATGQIAQVITHIPSGRALNVFSQFIDECSVLGGGKVIFWEIFCNLCSEEVLKANQAVNLNVFNASWKYDAGGSISGIKENLFDVKKMIASIAKSWLLQYQEACAVLDPDRDAKSFLLSGGLAHKGKFIKPVLEKILERTCIQLELRTGEETLDGLLILAEQENLKGQINETL
jgi:sugar (pentulose or hexulose) kinase